MDVLALVLLVGALLLTAYLTYGRWLSNRVFQLDPDAPTPATTETDDRDFVPTRKSIIFGHHFTSIAGTGPIVGPAIAVMWGWLPAVLWVVVGAIFIGAVHDMGSIVVSLRKKGRSIGDIAGDMLGPRARLIFLCILIVGLWIVLAIFGLVIAAVLRQYPASVFPVLVQIPLAIAIGLFVHKRGRSIVIPSIVSLGLMYAAVFWGDVGWLHQFNTTLAAQPIWLWVGFLLAYAYVASVLPVWVLLQPRDYINALQLLTALGLITVGLVVAATFGGSALGTGGTALRAVSESTASATGQSPVPPAELSIVAPMIDWQPVGAPPLFPVLFITIACGACSGFHCLVGSGTTSKQITRETDAKAVGYGSMLTEGFLATLVIAACTAGIGLGVIRQDFQKGLTINPATNGDYMRWVNIPSDPEDQPRRLVMIRDPRVNGFETFKVLRHPRDRVIDFPQSGRFVAEQTLGAPIILKDGSVSARSPEEYELTGRLAFNKQYESWSSAGSLGAKVGAFVEGAANFVAALGISRDIAIALMAIMVASFAATTMDTACRLQRYVVQELSSTFLPRVGKHACVQCGYDLSVHMEATRRSGDQATQGDADGPTSVASSLRRSVADSDPSVAPSLRRSVADSDPSVAPSLRRSVASPVTCPECGREHPASELALHDRESSWNRASALNPFKWLGTVHGATLFAVVTAALLAAIPPAGEPWTLANAGRGALILWPLFGATNQLLAGFAFVVIVAWLIVRKRPRWFAIPPAIIMLAVPASAMTWQAFIGNDSNPSWVAQGNWLLVTISVATLALETWLIVETTLRFIARKPRLLNE